MHLFYYEQGCGDLKGQFSTLLLDTFRADLL